MISNSMHIALLGPVFIPLAIALVLFASAGKENRPKLFLSFSMLNASFVFFGNYLYFTHDYTFYSYVHGFHIASVLCIYPALYIYVMLLVQPQMNRKKLLLHFIPALSFMVLSDVIFFPFLNSNDRVYFLDQYRYNPSFDNIWLQILWVVRMANVVVLFIQIPFYSVLIYRHQKKHVQFVNESFSNPWNVNLNWLSILNTTFVASAFICIFFYAINPRKLLGDERYLIYPFYLLSGIIAVIGVLGNTQKVIFQNEVHPEAINECYIETENELQKRLELYFDNKRPYLKDDLTIWDVSVELNTNRTYISNLINEKYGMNFSQFVNKYRVEYATEMKKLSPTKKMGEIAYESGFGSIATFNRAHKYFSNPNLSN
jgi:AraC-like DNA-binding protein